MTPLYSVILNAHSSLQRPRSSSSVYYKQTCCCSDTQHSLCVTEDFTGVNNMSCNSHERTIIWIYELVIWKHCFFTLNVRAEVPLIWTVRWNGTDQHVSLWLYLSKNKNKMWKQPFSQNCFFNEKSKGLEKGLKWKISGSKLCTEGGKHQK